MYGCVLSTYMCVTVYGTVAPWMVLSDHMTVSGLYIMTRTVTFLVRDCVLVYVQACIICMSVCMYETQSIS